MSANRFGCYVHVSHHAIERAREHLPYLADWPAARIRRVIHGLYGSGVPYGGQRGHDQWLLHCVSRDGRRAVVLACCRGDQERTIVIKTVLTEDHARANIEVYA